MQRMAHDEVLLVLAPRPLRVHRRLEPIVARVHGQLAYVAGAQPGIVQITLERQAEVKAEGDGCVGHRAATPSAHAANIRDRTMQTPALVLLSTFESDLRSSRN